MSWLYNRRFKIGAGLAVVAFVIANWVSYISASRHLAKQELRWPGFNWYASFVWGWPLPWVDWVVAVNLAVLLLGQGSGRGPKHQ